MTTILRNGIVAQEPQVRLEGTVECDEVYIVAGHKGHPESVQKKAKSPKTKVKRAARPGHRRNGQAASVRHNPARQSSNHTCVG